MNPIMAAPQDRRLTILWGQNPSDLDTYVKQVVTENGTENKLYYGAKTPAGSGMSLVRDDTSSFGPETVTLESPAGDPADEGKLGYSYVYYIKDQSGTGIELPLLCQLFSGTTEDNGNYAPIDYANATGDKKTAKYWHICNMDENGNIQIVNQVSVDEPDYIKTGLNPTDYTPITTLSDQYKDTLSVLTPPLDLLKI